MASNLAVTLPILLVIYLVIIDFIDLYPYNDIARRKSVDRKWEFLNYILISLGALCNATDSFALHVIALCMAGICMVGYISAWWVPYIFGHWSEWSKKEYEFSFGRTIKILPAIKDHPIPDLEHLPVGALIAAWLVAAFYSL